MEEQGGPHGWADVAYEAVRSRWFPWALFVVVSGLFGIAVSRGLEIGFVKIPGVSPAALAGKTMPSPDPAPSPSGPDYQPSGWDIDSYLAVSRGKGVFATEIQLPTETNPDKKRKATIQYKIIQQNPQPPLNHTTWVVGARGYHVAYADYLPVEVQARVQLEGGAWSLWSTTKKLDRASPTCVFVFRAY